MKILRIVSSGYEQGGAENGLVLTNEYLRRDGHEVRVVSSNARPDLPHFSEYEFEELPYGGVAKMVRATFNLEAYRLIKDVVEEFQPDVVTLHTMLQPTAAALYALKGQKIVVCVHGPEAYTKALLPWVLPVQDYRIADFRLRHLNLGGWAHYLYYRFLSRPLYRFGFRWISGVFTFSTYTKQLMANEGLDSVCIPEGVNLFDYSAVNPRSSTLAYVGRLEKYKGVDDLINAMPAILQRVPKAKLLVAGDGPHRAALEQLAADLGLQKQVQFLGHLPIPEVAKLYRKAAIATLPSTVPETFGKSGVEAMSVGRPVLATNVGGVSDWLQDGKNGYFVNTHDPADIADKAVRLLSDPKRLQRMGKAARATAQKFSMEAFAKGQEKALLAIVRGK